MERIPTEITPQLFEMIIHDCKSGISENKIEKKYRIGRRRLRKLIPADVMSRPLKERKPVKRYVPKEPKKKEYPDKELFGIKPGMVVINIATKRRGIVYDIHGKEITVMFSYGIGKNNPVKLHPGDVVIDADQTIPEYGHEYRVKSDEIPVPETVDFRKTDFRFLVL